MELDSREKKLLLNLKHGDQIDADGSWWCSLCQDFVLEAHRHGLLPTEHARRTDEELANDTKDRTTGMSNKWVDWYARFDVPRTGFVLDVGDEEYRYLRLRWWRQTSRLPKLMGVILRTPSPCHQIKTQKKIERAMSCASGWGFDGVAMTYLNPTITIDRDDEMAVLVNPLPQQVLATSRAVLLSVGWTCSMLLAAWGAAKTTADRTSLGGVLKGPLANHNFYAVRVNEDGEPASLLYGLFPSNGPTPVPEVYLQNAVTWAK